MKRKFLFLTAAWVVATAVASAPVMADDAQLLAAVQSMQDQMKDMQRTIQQQNQKIQRLESQGPVSTGAAVSDAGASAPMSDYEFNERLSAATGGANKWLKDLKFSGDLRLRYEAFDYEEGSSAESDSRNRFRYRLRYGFEKKFSDEMKIGFGMASGENSGTNGLNVDPTSTNTTLDNNFNFKAINIEKAYAAYSPDFAKIGPIENFTITGGKMNNPFEKGSSDMIWDRDVKPEGLTEQFNFKVLDSDNFDMKAFFTAGQFILDEDSAKRGDANLFAYQFGVNPVIYTPLFEKPVDVLQAFSFYDYNNYARNNNFVIGGTSLARGNPNVDQVSTELDAGNFKVIESYSELAIYPLNIPTRFFVDFAYNPGGDPNYDGTILGNEEQFANAFGVKFGGILEKGDWELGYAYKHIGANAVVGAFNDSDFGDGHAGKAGHVFKAGYALTDSLTLNAAALFVENLNAYSAGILGQKQRRFQVDLVWKF